MYTLIVIDMQPGFNASKYTSVQTTIQQEIKDAKEQKADIILVEFAGYGNTLDELSSLVDGYDRGFSIYKSTDDGSSEVQHEITKQGCMITRFRVVGINTDYCVLATIRGLRNRFPSTIIEAVEDGCGSEFSHEHGLKKIQELPNVAVI